VPPEERDMLLERAAERIAQRAGTMPDEPKARMESAVTFLNQQGYVARWEETGPGAYLIYVSSCPYHHVSKDHSETCQIDQSMIQLLTGADVERLKNEAKKGKLCVYAIHWPT
jgi:predicted ArsR family transcriptional regulator